MSEFLSTTYPVAAKLHFCNGTCGGCILQGERYTKVVGRHEIWNDEFRTLRLCGRCESPQPRRDLVGEAQAKADAWNARYPVGTPVRYWTGLREGPGKTGETRAAAEVLKGHTAVVWVTGLAGCVALSHVEVRG